MKNHHESAIFETCQPHLLIGVHVYVYYLCKVSQQPARAQTYWQEVASFCMVSNTFHSNTLIAIIIVSDSEYLLDIFQDH